MTRFFLCAALLMFSVRALANEPHIPPAALENKPLKPAKKYEGNTPIDRTNGIPFNNGTFGERNLPYEKWAQTPVLVPGVSELPYNFADKDALVAGLEESALFVEVAIANWKKNGHLSKPEVKEYADQSVAKMQQQLDAYRAVVSKTASTDKDAWDRQQNDARRSLVELRATYASLHHNVR